MTRHERNVKFIFSDLFFGEKQKLNK